MYVQISNGMVTQFAMLGVISYHFCDATQVISAAKW